MESKWNIMVVVGLLSQVCSNNMILHHDNDDDDDDDHDFDYDCNCDENKVHSFPLPQPPPRHGAGKATNRGRKFAQIIKHKRIYLLLSNFVMLLLVVPCLSYICMYIVCAFHSNFQPRAGFTFSSF